MSVEDDWLSSFYASKNKLKLRIGSTEYLPNPGQQLISALISYGTKFSNNTVPEQ